MIIKILAGFAIALVALVVVVSMQPARFRVERSALMAAPPSAVFAQVDDFHHWEKWSPWAKMDPNSKGTFEGPPSGEGSSFAWSGNDKVGEGKMTIIRSQPEDLILIRLEFLKPFKATNTAEFTFVPEGEGTRVTWAMSGENNFVGKAIGLVMNCDKMIGAQFEQGLASIKSIVETKTATP